MMPLMLDKKNKAVIISPLKILQEEHLMDRTKYGHDRKPYRGLRRHVCLSESAASESEPLDLFHVLTSQNSSLRSSASLTYKNRVENGQPSPVPCNLTTVR